MTNRDMDVDDNSRNADYDTGGVYEVKESGTVFRHQPGPPTPRDGKEWLSRFRSRLRLRVLEHPHPRELVFEMVHADVSLANALRRIMIDEVPSVAIETVHIWNNTSIVHDETLAHRLGLVPLNVDHRRLDPWDEEDEEEEATERNTIVFRTKVECKRPRGGGKNKRGDGDDDDDEPPSRDEDPAVAAAREAAARSPLFRAPDRPYTRNVYSKDLRWVPQGSQETTLFPEQTATDDDDGETKEGGRGGLRPCHEDILLAKLRPGQSIEFEAHARVGVGKDHAKYSPVATACYRLMPRVRLLKPVYDDLAEELDIYEPGVFRIVPCTDPDDLAAGHTKKAVVDNPYACTMSRNLMRNPVLRESVEITRVPDHFIFSVESVGALPAAVVLAESVKILKAKCENLARMVDDHEDNGGNGVAA